MPNGTAKPLALIKGHRTKEEKEFRKKGEAALKSDIKIQMSPAVKKNDRAKKHFKRLVKIFASIQMEDAFYENVLNRYCMLLAEHDADLEERERLQNEMQTLMERKCEMEYKEYLDAYRGLMNIIICTDKAIAKRRDQLFQIEKDNLLTVQSKLRAVPKNPDKGDATSPMEAYMRERGRA